MTTEPDRVVTLLMTGAAIAMVLRGIARVLRGSEPIDRLVRSADPSVIRVFESQLGIHNIKYDKQVRADLVVELRFSVGDRVYNRFADQVALDFAERGFKLRRSSGKLPGVVGE